MKIRGTLALGIVGLVLLAADVVQRTLIAGAVRMLPSRRDRILAAWMQLMRRAVMVPVSTVGGARFGDLPTVPHHPGTLVLMNHQSLLDIPLVVAASHPAYPRIVTRERYAQGKPLISHMVRLYQYPTVNPRATNRAHLTALTERARTAPGPVVIFPEGTRTRDGTIGRFKRTGLRTLLATREWEVWVITIDGYWQCAKLADFRAGVSTIRGRARTDGPFASPAPDAPPEELDAFIDAMEARMRESLDVLRGGVPA